jgi:hypothetical protein
MYSDTFLVSIYRITSSQQPPSCQFHKLTPTLFCSSKHEDTSGEDSEGTIKPKKNEEAIKKLNVLLKLMAKVAYETIAIVRLLKKVWKMK